MIVGLGIDIVDVARIERMENKHSGRFSEKLLSSRELAELLARGSPPESLAGRFAAKEAAMKALSTGWGEGVGWKDVEILREGGGAPKLAFSGESLKVAENLGASRFHVSITHDGGVAVAVVILESLP